jgi:N-acetylmuramoyl-L-alanine amidase
MSTVAPLVATALEPPAATYQSGTPRKMVVIDPGHGGYEPGVAQGAQTSRRINGQHYHEKDVVLQIAQYLERYVKSAPNMDATMTRRSDTYVSLDRRIELANQAKGDLFISIHLNGTSSRSKTARGFEIFYLTNEDRAVNRQLVAMENDEKVELDTQDSSGETLRELLRLLANEKFPQVQAASRNLCTVINEEFCKAGPFQAHNRGVKSEAFRVLLNFNMPAALAECGFIDNDDEARLLIQPAVQQQIAALLFNGINRYFATVDPKFKPHMVQVRN